MHLHKHFFFFVGKAKDGYFWSYATNYAVLNLLVTPRVWLVPSSISFSFSFSWKPTSFFYCQLYSWYLLFSFVVIIITFLQLFSLCYLWFLQWKQYTTVPATYTTKLIKSIYKFVARVCFEEEKMLLHGVPRVNCTKPILGVLHD